MRFDQLCYRRIVAMLAFVEYVHHGYCGNFNFGHKYSAILWRFWRFFRKSLLVFNGEPASTADRKMGLPAKPVKHYYIARMKTFALVVLFAPGALDCEFKSTNAGR